MWRQPSHEHAMAKPVLKYAGKQPPLAIIAASKLTGIDIDLKEDLLNGGSPYETLVLPSGYGHRHAQQPRATQPTLLYCREQLQGVGSALRYFGRSASANTNLYGTTTADACLVRACHPHTASNIPPT